MFKNTSLFGYQSENPVDRAAYDMMVMQDMGILEADTKPGELNAPTGGSLDAPVRGWM